MSAIGHSINDFSLSAYVANKTITYQILSDMASILKHVTLIKILMTCKKNYSTILWLVNKEYSKIKLKNGTQNG